MDFLCLDFINSSWYITHKLFIDPLSDKDWLIKLADNWNIRHLPKPEEEEIEHLIEMRSIFDALLKKLIAENKLTNQDLEIVNKYMADVCFYRELQVDDNTTKLVEVPIQIRWSWFMAEVAASFAKLYTSCYIESIKACHNPDCGWFFVDNSKSRSRKWCDDNCATLMKVRRFREKQKTKNE